MTTWPDVAMAVITGPIGVGIAAALTGWATSRGLLQNNKRQREATDKAFEVKLRERDKRIAALESKLGWKPRAAHMENDDERTKP